ncbi:hypothetical protein Pelo_4527 [Pelomyxa schiedti]|nr:hypothetical protein Pelo_4527 [Pelomyxa schiedti]
MTLLSCFLWTVPQSRWIPWTASRLGSLWLSSRRRYFCVIRGILRDLGIYVIFDADCSAACVENKEFHRGGKAYWPPFSPPELESPLCRRIFRLHKSTLVQAVTNHFLAQGITPDRTQPYNNHFYICFMDESDAKRAIKIPLPASKLKSWCIQCKEIVIDGSTFYLSLPSTTRFQGSVKAYNPHRMILQIKKPKSCLHKREAGAPTWREIDAPSLKRMLEDKFTERPTLQLRVKDIELGDAGSGVVIAAADEANAGALLDASIETLESALKDEISRLSKSLQSAQDEFVQCTTIMSKWCLDASKTFAIQLIFFFAPLDFGYLNQQVHKFVQSIVLKLILP